MNPVPRTIGIFFAIVLVTHTIATEHGDASTFTVATWNSYDVVFGAQREARRNYYFANKETLFADIDILCTQESHTYESISDFETNFGSVFPYSFYHDAPSTTYQACTQAEIADFQNSTSSIYDCNLQCADSNDPGTLFYFVCLWACFGELRDNTTGITTRDNNPRLFDFGQALELSPCISCLWRSNYISSMTDDWDAMNATAMEMFDDVVDVCTASQNTFDYKPNEGIMLWSKYEFDSVEFVKLPEAVWLPRGYIKATIAEPAVTVICTHLESPIVNAYFNPFTTMREENIEAGVTEMSNITQMDAEALATLIADLDENVIVIGDFNIGIGARVDIYDGLVQGGGLSNVFGTNEEVLESLNCTRCRTNIFANGIQEIVDHVLIKGDIEVDSAMRFLDVEYNISGQMMPLSDHFGVKATLYLPEFATTEEPEYSTTEEDSVTAGDIDDSTAETIQWKIACAIVLLFVLSV